MKIWFLNAISSVVVNSFLGIFGLVATISQFIIWFKPTELCYRKITWKISEKLITETCSHCSSREGIDETYITSYAIWNSGRKIIDKENVAPKKPLKITCSGKTKIIGSNIRYVSGKENGAELVGKEDEVVVKFDFLRGKEGMIVDISYHGNPKDMQLDCSLKVGKLKEKKSLWDVLTNNKLKYWFTNSLFTQWICSFVMAVMIPIAIIRSANYKPIIPNNLPGLPECAIAYTIDRIIILFEVIGSWIISALIFIHIVFFPSMPRKIQDEYMK